MTFDSGNLRRALSVAACHPLPASPFQFGLCEQVPVIREELFVERLAVCETTRAETDEIAEGETLRVPLMREQVVVTKRPVVKGEVVIGKRQVTETQRLSETTREEQLGITSRHVTSDLSRLYCGGRLGTTVARQHSGLTMA
jgi:uncharacterized protein (TIGR02271 family)